MKIQRWLRHMICEPCLKIKAQWSSIIGGRASLMLLCVFVTKIRSHEYITFYNAPWDDHIAPLQFQWVVERLPQPIGTWGLQIFLGQGWYHHGDGESWKTTLGCILLSSCYLLK